MKIQNAYLCEDCQEIVESNGHGRCDVCGSLALLNLAKILNRNPQEEILNFAPLVSARVTDEEVVLCVSSNARDVARSTHQLPAPGSQIPVWTPK